MQGAAPERYPVRHPQHSVTSESVVTPHAQQAGLMRGGVVAEMAGVKRVRAAPFVGAMLWMWASWVQLGVM